MSFKKTLGLEGTASQNRSLVAERACVPQVVPSRRSGVMGLLRPGMRGVGDSPHAASDRRKAAGSKQAHLGGTTDINVFVIGFGSCFLLQQKEGLNDVLYKVRKK